MDDFLLAFNNMATFENPKENLAIKYKIKDLSEAKMIIG